MKFNILHTNSQNPVDSLLSNVLIFSVQYGNLTPNERKDFDAKLETFANTNNPKCDSKKEPTTQTANLGGNTEFDNESEDSEYIKQLKERSQPKPNPQPKHLLINKTELLTPEDQPKKIWLNNIAE